MESLSGREMLHEMLHDRVAPPSTSRSHHDHQLARLWSVWHDLSQTLRRTGAGQGVGVSNGCVVEMGQRRVRCWRLVRNEAVEVAGVASTSRCRIASSSGYVLAPAWPGRMPGETARGL